MTERRVALVTGGSSGIGRAASVALAAAGFAVAFGGRREEELNATKDLCGEGEVLPVRCDVTDEGEVQAFFADTARTFGRVDFVFNNAGLSTPAARIDEVELETFRRAVDVNLVGAFLVAREAFRLMKAQDPQGGRILNNGSISAHAPRPNAVPYNATKHAISGLTKSISLEGRPYSIACGQIDIGNTASAMTAKMASGMLQADGRMVPEPTFDVQHVADAVVHMAKLPLDVNVYEMTIMATNMPYIGRG